MHRGSLARLFVVGFVTAIVLCAAPPVDALEIPRVSASVAPNVISIGQRAPVKGTAGEFAAHSTVSVQRRLGDGTWSTRAVGDTDGGGRFYVPIQPTSVGIYALRVRSSVGYSDVFHLRVAASPGVVYDYAAQMVRAAGWTPLSNVGFLPGSGLAAISAYPLACGGGCPQRLFFFGAGKLLGTDTGGSGAVGVAVSGTTTVTAVYYLYRWFDSGCCPTGGERRVTFKNVAGALRITSGSIPPATGDFGRQPP